MKTNKKVERWVSRFEEIYRALEELEAKLRAPPSVREIVEHIGLEPRHISRVHKDLINMVKLGPVEDLDIGTRRYRATIPSEEVDWEKLLRRFFDK